MGTGYGGDLKEVIFSQLREDRAVPPLTTESWLRVSGLASMCAREEVLCSRRHKTRQDVVDPDLMLIFEHGHGLHWDLQNRILPQTKTLVGRWLCGSCGTVHGGQSEWETPVDVAAEQDVREAVRTFHDLQSLRPATCPKCGSPLTSDNSLYQEQWIKHRQLRLAGHPDVFLRAPWRRGLGIFEAKSIGSKGAWEVRNCAKLDHVVQAQCYMWLTGCRWGVILYWDKGTAGLKGLIEHVVEYDEEHVASIRALIADIWGGVEGGKLPERICHAANCKRAELCSSVETCFQEID